MQRLYDFDKRVLSCSHCGAPLESPPTGGLVACTYCNAQNQVTPRQNERFELDDDHHQMSEADRLAMLKSQEQVADPLPDGLTDLADAEGALRASEASRAETLWRQSLDSLKRHPAATLAAELSRLTVMLGSHYAAASDALRERGIYESALDVLSLPIQRQAMLTRLARNAALEGDFASAERWLAMCDPRPADIISDNRYRIARALIDTLQQRWEKVIDTLGQTQDEIPVHQSRRVMVGLLRTHALEQSGRPLAAAELRRALGSGKQLEVDLALLDRLRGTLQEQGLSLCPESSRIVTSFLERDQAVHFYRSLRQDWGKVFLAVGVVLILLLALLLVFALTSPLPGYGYALGALIFLLSIASMVRGMRRYRMERLYFQIRWKGIRTAGEVVRVSPMSRVAADVPQFHEVTLQMSLAGRPPYEASTKIYASRLETDQLFGTGTEVTVKVHPKHLKSIRIQ